MEVQSNMKAKWYCMANADEPSEETDIKTNKVSCLGIRALWLDTPKNGPKDTLALTQFEDWIPFDSVTRWGYNIIKFNPAAGNFSLVNPDKADLEQKISSEVKEIKDQQRRALSNFLQNSNSFTIETGKLLEKLYPTVSVQFVNKDTGKEYKLTECPKALSGEFPDMEGCCNIKKSGFIEHKSPTISTHGPVNAKTQRYQCTKHEVSFNTSTPEIRSALIKKNIRRENGHVRIGNYRFSVGALLFIHLSAMDCIPSKQVRRTFL